MPTFIGKILREIASVVKNLGSSIFHHVVSGAEKTWNELPDETKQALIHGSGVLQIIDSMASSTVSEVRTAIQEAYPDLDEAGLEQGLFAIAHVFNLAVQENDLDDCIAKLQAYLASKDGVEWGDIMHGASLLLAVILAPKGTVLGALSTLLEFVYQTFIKKG